MTNRKLSNFAAHLPAARGLLPSAVQLGLHLGLGTRFAALGLFVMTGVIQLFVYPDALVSTHLGWMAMAAAVIVYGPGRFALDARLFGGHRR